MKLSSHPPRRAFWAWLLVSAFAPAAELEVHLPRQRTAYQDNEWIDLSVVRSARDPLPRSDIVLRLTSDDGSHLAFTFSSDKLADSNGKARAVEHLHLNGWLLRPGNYLVEAACGVANASTNISIHSHIRHSDYRLINWGRAQGRDLLGQGEENLGFNLFYGNNSSAEDASLIRAGVDFAANCVMSGGHQMDLRAECDWSDPCVIRGGTRRAVRRAFMDRTQPNVAGVHFYDEPGLTHAKDPDTGEFTPHAVEWQARSFEAAFGEPPLDWKKVNPNQPESASRWRAWTYWKLGLMDAAWQDAQFGVSAVRPEYISVTQSQYGYSAFSDGYYFNVVRSLPVISGHGGYHDFGPGYFNPSLFLEFARANDLARPNWYLPTWHGQTTADEFRLEQYLSFQCNLQGMISPPDLDPAPPEKSAAAQGIVESNHLLARLGTIFNTLPVTRPPVALLYSLSQAVHEQTRDRKSNYMHDTAHGRNVLFTYLAGKRLQHQFMPVLDEEVRNGTVAAHHRAIILTSMDFLDPEVLANLEAFVKQGGLVLLTADCTVNVTGAVKLDVTPAWPDAERIAELRKTGKDNEAGQLQRLRQALAGAQKLADALRPHLEKAGIQPPLRSSDPGLAVTRQAAGDLEYLFVVNAAHDPAGDPMLGLKAATATLSLADDGRPVYDAIHSRVAREFVKQGAQRRATLRFGPGQMRVLSAPRGRLAG